MNQEPRNPLYFLLLLAGLAFTATALAVALVPVLEEKAKDAGTMPPASAFRDSLRTDGWKWLLWQVGAIIILGLASMVVDRIRRLKKERAAATILPKAPTGQNPT